MFKGALKMKIDNENCRKFGMVQCTTMEPCKVCGEQCKHLDYCINERFCSTECQDKHYGWDKKKKKKAKVKVNA